MQTHVEKPLRWWQWRCFSELNFFFSVVYSILRLQSSFEVFPKGRTFYIYWVIRTMVTCSTQILFGNAEGKQNHKAVSFPYNLKCFS